MRPHHLASWPGPCIGFTYFVKKLSLASIGGRQKPWAVIAVPGVISGPDKLASKFCRRTMPLHHCQITISMEVELPDHVVAAQLSFNLKHLAMRVAAAVVEREAVKTWGYYPAFDYLIDDGGITPELAETFNSACRAVAHSTTALIQQRLRAAFSRVHVIGLHHLAYNIPKVSPAAPDKKERLAVHYRPNTMHVELELSQIHKQPVSEAYENFARRLVYRWLADYFDRLEIISLSSHRRE